MVGWVATHLRRLGIEVFKTLKFLNPHFMHTYFKKGSLSARRKSYFVINRVKTATFGEKWRRTWDPKFGILSSKTQLIFQNLQNSLKHGTDQNANATAFGFLMFSGGIERDQWHEMGKVLVPLKLSELTKIIS